MKPPQGINHQRGKVFKLQKSSYGLKQGAQRWWTVLSQFLTSTMEFTQCVADPCLFYKIVSTKDFAIIMSVYVDDILLCTTTEQVKDSIIKELYDKFKITDEGDFTWSLGMHVETSPDRHTIKLDMQRYIINALTRFNFDDLKTSTIPMDPNVKFSENDCPIDQNAKNEMKFYPFREALGVLMFLMVTMRFDIAFPTISLSRFSNNPSKEMWSAVKRIYQYLKGTSDMVITYTRMMNTKNPLMIAYTDAGWSSTDIDHRRAVIGYIILLAGGAVSWLTKFNRPGLSSCETEYYGMGAVSTEIVSHTHLVNELKPLQWKLNSDVEHSDDIDPITIYGDNQSAQKIARHPHLHKRMKHTHIRHHVIRSFVELLIIRFQFVPGPQNCADIMVKASNKTTLRRHRSAASGRHVHPKIVNTPEEILRQRQTQNITNASETNNYNAANKGNGEEKEGEEKASKEC